MTKSNQPSEVAPIEVAIDRRAALATGLAGGLATGFLSGAAKAATDATGGASLTGPTYDLTTAYGNVEAYAKATSNLDMKSTHYGWIDGHVMGVAPGGPIRTFCGFRGLGVTRLIPLEGEHGYRRLLREVVFYTDLETGEILEEMENPFTGEKVRVVPVANDPFNRIIRESELSRPTFGGLNVDEKLEEKPFILNWKAFGDRLMMERHINLYYPNALDPKKWVRESAGPMNQVTETYVMNMSLKDIQNPDLTTVDSTTVWGRHTPWLPWMLMGQAPGHCLYNVMAASMHSLEEAPDQRIIEYIAKNYTKFLDAPTEWEEPSLSSLEWYAREQEPAPPGGV
ncbi:MAG: DUF1838 family protein [Rhodospirillaceae bacterium]